MLDWLAFVPRTRESPVPIMPALDPVDRPIEFTPTKTPYDPRWMIAGHEKTGRLAEGLLFIQHSTEKRQGSDSSLQPVLSSALYWEPLSSILAFSVNDPLRDLPNFPRNG